jgi:hypothetical protein
MTKLDAAWQKIFQALELAGKIEQDGYTYLSAEQIKQHGQEEPRLMTKFDTAEVRPETLKKNDVSIFSVTNGTYILFKDKAKKSYFSFPELAETPIMYSSKIDLGNFDSYPSGQFTTESQTIDFAFISSILKTFTNEKELYLTIRGRTRCGQLAFHLPSIDHKVSVSGVQIELDAGFESPDAIYLIEAKIGKRDNFHIRQLYYPYLEWSQRSKKKIVPIFFTYSNGLFYLTELSFSAVFGDLKIVRSACYILDESPKATLDLARIFLAVPEEHEIEPFPQANDLDKVIDLVMNIAEGVNEKRKISQFFEFDDRQGDYYANATRYLGFTERSPDGFTLTEVGKHFVRISSRNERTKLLFSQLVKRPSFREIIHLLLKNECKIESLPKQNLSEIIARHTSLSGSTPVRRASTMFQWLQWLIRNSELKV